LIRLDPTEDENENEDDSGADGGALPDLDTWQSNLDLARRRCDESKRIKKG